MGQVHHGSTTTTAAVRRAIQDSQESLRALAKHYGINQKTKGHASHKTAMGFQGLFGRTSTCVLGGRRRKLNLTRRLKYPAQGKRILKVRVERLWAEFTLSI
ncbi:IS481 family transposase [Nitrobacter sp. TKz-YC01]